MYSHKKLAAKTQICGLHNIRTMKKKKKKKNYVDTLNITTSFNVLGELVLLCVPVRLCAYILYIIHIGIKWKIHIEFQETVYLFPSLGVVVNSNKL